MTNARMKALVDDSPTLTDGNYIRAGTGNYISSDCASRLTSGFTTRVDHGFPATGRLRMGEFLGIKED